MSRPGRRGSPAASRRSSLPISKSIIAPLTRVAEIRALRRTATNLLNTYVGRQAGERILAGKIRRGFVEEIRAAIWLSDMRGFTALSERLPPQELVDLLNRYFDCQVPAILEHGGEVLKFIGDGLLAIFPLADDGDDAGEVCRRALACAREARRLHRGARRAGGSDTRPIRFGLALHVGQVMYGNIGGGNRLDFTCIGPAVNLAARLEKVAAAARPDHRGVGGIRRACAAEVHAARRIRRGGLRRAAGGVRLDRTRRNDGASPIMSADDYHPFMPNPPERQDRRADGARACRGADQATRARKGCSANWERMFNGPFRGITTAGQSIPDLFAPRPEGAPTLAMIEAVNALLGRDVAGAEEGLVLSGRLEPVAALAEHRALCRALRASPRRDQRAAARRGAGGAARQHEPARLRAVARRDEAQPLPRRHRRTGRR